MGRKVIPLRGLGATADQLQQFGREWSLIPADTIAKILAVANTSSPQAFVSSIAGGSLGFEPPGGSNNQWGPTGYIMRDETMRQFIGDPRYAGIQDKFEPLYVFDEQNFESALLEWQIKPQYAGAWDFLKNHGYVQLSPNPVNGSIAQYGNGYGIQDYSQVYFDPKFGLYTPLTNIKPEPSQSSFFDTFGPWILLLGPLLYAASTVIAAGAAGAAEGAAAASAVGEGATAASIGEAAATTSLSEAAVAGEEALREIGLAQSLGATITQGEAAGWVAALENAGLAIPGDIASIASGASSSSSAGYESTPSPDISDIPRPNFPSSNASGVESIPTNPEAGVTYQPPPEPSAPSWLSQSTSAASNQLVSQAGKAAVTAAVKAALPTAGRTQSYSSGFAPLVAPAYSASGASGDGVDFNTQQSSTTRADTVVLKKPFPWWLLVVAGGAAIAYKRSKQRG